MLSGRKNGHLWNQSSTLLSGINITPPRPIHEHLLIWGAKRGNIESRNKLITLHYTLIVQIAIKQTSYNHPLLSDLVQEGVFGDIVGIDRFDLGHGVRYMSYGYWWIRDAMASLWKREETWSRRSMSDLDLPDDSPYFSQHDTLIAKALQEKDVLEVMLSMTNGDISPKQKEVLRQMYNADERSTQEIADDLGCTSNWVARLKRKALVSLKETVGPVEDWV